jgi:hypothetical protein
MCIAKAIAVVESVTRYDISKVSGSHTTRCGLQIRAQKERRRGMLIENAM